MVRSVCIEKLFVQHVLFLQDSLEFGVICTARTHNNHQNQSPLPPCMQSYAFGSTPLPLCVRTFYIFTPFPLINFYSDSRLHHSQFLGYFHFYLSLSLNFTFHFSLKPPSSLYAIACIWIDPSPLPLCVRTMWMIPSVLKVPAQTILA